MDALRIAISYCVFPALYRLGGAPKFPKALRRYGIPVAIYALNPVWPVLIGAGLVCLVLHFNLDEIEEQDWDDVFCYGMAISWGFYPLAGIWSGIIGLFWIIGVVLSNSGPKIDWKWVEIGMGVAMAASIHLGSL